ncbi:MAG: YggS family pyridoxal phosphate-dependent enzyme [Phycisphaerae bacterium]|nr:YggS family pyridoxal phosphate-dependent enzyme [Phycisphaerae bacterium]
MPTVDSLRDRFMEVRERLSAAAGRSGRSERDVVLVAVSKYAEPDQIRELISMGHRDFGENQVQQLVQRAVLIDEWLGRQRVLPQAGLRAGQPPPTPVRWHMIGHLQRNKARKPVEFCRLIHSVDSLRLAEEIQAAAAKREQPAEVLVQVNVSGEASKFGCAIPAAYHLAEQIDTMVKVRVRGLMTMAPHGSGPEISRRVFARLRELFEEIRAIGVGEPHFNILSMGMTDDFEIAIEEGANMVRVGSAIFGRRTEGEPETPDEDA